MIFVDLLAPSGVDTRLELTNRHWEAIRCMVSAADRVASLTTREHQVLRLLGAGMSNSRIARVLEVSERTAKAHVARILEKLGVESRLQAGLVALQVRGKNATVS